MEKIKADAKEYGGYNLICMDLSKKDQPHEMVYFSNRENSEIADLSPGTIYGKFYVYGYKKPNLYWDCGVALFQEVKKKEKWGGRKRERNGKCSKV